jgi:metal-responsive CopG/Arc/MetJ family transcriptional regulator
VVTSRTERKIKLTVSVKEKLADFLDAKVAQLKVSRSEAVEKAIELWLRKLTEEDEKAYFAAASSEKKKDFGA